MDVRLVPAKAEEIPVILRMQREAFAGLLEKYQDTETSPATEELEDISFRFHQPETTYYFIVAGEEKVGVIRVVDRRDGKTRKRISPIFIMPAHRNKGCAQRAIALAEQLHGASGWRLETILQEPANCHLYEKLGYTGTGEAQVVNDRLTLVVYEKDG